MDTANPTREIIGWHNQRPIVMLYVGDLVTNTLYRPNEILRVTGVKHDLSCVNGYSVTTDPSVSYTVDIGWFTLVPTPSKPERSKFWVLLSEKNVRPSVVQYFTLDEAKQKAESLALSEGISYYVMEAVEVVATTSVEWRKLS